MSKGTVRPTSYNIKALPGYTAPKIHAPKPAKGVAPHEGTVNAIPTIVRPGDGALFTNDIIVRTLARLGKRIVKKDARFLAAQLLVREKTAKRALEKLNARIRHLVSARQWATSMGNIEEVRLAKHQIAFLKSAVLQMKDVRTRKGVAYRRLAHLDDVASTVRAKRKMIIDRLEGARNKAIKLSAKERAKLLADLKLLDGAMKLNSDVSDGSFIFADARVVLLKLKIRIYAAALKGDRQELAKGKRLMDGFQSAMIYSAQAQSFADVFTSRFPAALRDAITSGRNGFPIISDSYGAWHMRGAPRPDVIEGLPIVKVFKQFMGDNPEKAGELTSIFTAMVRGKMGSFESAEEFVAAFEKWRTAFDGAMNKAEDPKGAFKLFFEKLASYEEKHAPPRERYLAWVQKLDVKIAYLNKIKHLDKDAFAVVLAELDGLATKVLGRDPHNLFIYDENADPISAIEASFTYHKEPTTLAALRWNAHELRKKALKKLAEELDSEIGQTRALPTLMDMMSKIHELKDRLVSEHFDGDRRQVMDDLLRNLDYVRLEGMSHAMLGTLESYRTSEKEIQTCTGGNWFWRQGCKVGRWGVGGDGVHRDVVFGPMIADVKSMKEKMHGTLGQRDKGMAALRKMLHGSMWKDVQEYGDDTVSTIGWTRMVGWAGNIAALLLPTTLAAQGARMLTYALMAKRAKDVVGLAQVARIASIMETGTMATSMAVMELGMDKNVWLGYDGNKGEWNWNAFAMTAEKSFYYGATFGLGKWFSTRYMNWARGFAQKHKIDLATMGWRGRALVGAGQLGAMYAGFTVADGAMGVIERAKQKGVVAVLSSPTEILKGFGAMFDAEKAKKRLILTVMVKATDLILKPLASRANRWMLESGPYKAYIDKVQQSMNTVMGQLQGNSVQVAKALRTLELEMANYATMLESLGMGGSNQYAQVSEAIRMTRAYHRVFDAHYGVAGVRSEKGYFTYTKGRDTDLVEALRGLGARNIQVKDGVVEANVGARRYMDGWVGGESMTFMPRKPANIKDGPVSYLKGVWSDMTPAQKTAMWIFGLPVAFKFGAAYPLLTSGMGLVGMGWQGTTNLYRSGTFFAR